MAINPVLAQDSASGELFPLPQGGETFVLKRDNIHFEAHLPSGAKLKGVGVFYLSSKRIVFLVKSKPSRADFKSFEIPLATLTSPKFEQPIFWANYLWGKVAPLDTDAQGPLAGGRTKVYLTFWSGGCGTFLPLFYQIMSQIVQEQVEGGEVIQAAAEGRLNQVAYVDPSDPSVLFLAQPQATPNTEERTEFNNERR
mmetsp:Transcript_50001/g.131773  ORF Transcript_50001/g.131773 Transcript_50001/m.131773 type:complete len:197 (-) Transcript_50001:88-678(-)